MRLERLYKKQKAASLSWSTNLNLPGQRLQRANKIASEASKGSGGLIPGVIIMFVLLCSPFILGSRVNTRRP